MSEERAQPVDTDGPLDRLANIADALGSTNLIRARQIHDELRILRSRVERLRVPSGTEEGQEIERLATHLEKEVERQKGYRESDKGPNYTSGVLPKMFDGTVFLRMEDAEKIAALLRSRPVQEEPVAWGVQRRNSPARGAVVHAVLDRRIADELADSLGGDDYVRVVPLGVLRSDGPGVRAGRCTDEHNDAGQCELYAEHPGAHFTRTHAFKKGAASWDNFENDEPPSAEGIFRRPNPSNTAAPDEVGP
jgi:hypothetical protein